MAMSGNVSRLPKSGQEEADKTHAAKDLAEKRRSSDQASDVPPKKKVAVDANKPISIGFGTKTPLDLQTQQCLGNGDTPKEQNTQQQCKPAGPIKMNLGGVSLTKKPVPPIKMALSTSAKPKASVTPIMQTVKKSKAVAQAFNQDDESDEDEMPPEAKMRMRNLGRDTPTAAGPNSFGKGQYGFCDRRKMMEKELKKQMDDVAPKD
ncbi:PEST proteolytic signal-containing nuclear protein [Lingula anatina]|uniref:PEST proteolytic signal-containing nuclear protein n=1 Tax=Lingula anatina TaxID=7574 RepID=A0A1S3I6C8_LINAN|nr:PEST proteolytic signal-containing nuclear protein [Lingula anatina]|eukprot:XP_013393401.1 PEST proteolytic signal-containing nuclear protein [Lingula anatina]